MVVGGSSDAPELQWAIRGREGGSIEGLGDWRLKLRLTVGDNHLTILPRREERTGASDSVTIILEDAMRAREISLKAWEVHQRSSVTMSKKKAATMVSKWLATQPEVSAAGVSVDGKSVWWKLTFPNGSSMKQGMLIRR